MRLGLTERISGIRTGNLQILSVTCYPTTSLSPESVPETIEHGLASSFSMNYRFFSLTLNIFHTLSQCHHSNFKHVNDGWEVLR